ncbi:sigma-70 family RNA polymerase sigma factor [Nonomuraea sp. NPDC049695]|uniref:RNA polymerase sigma factor n=1 Tax=Nonomuraea sp. NPDC049695 TaxID=3154734 RepID=UPI003427D886
MRVLFGRREPPPVTDPDSTDAVLITAIAAGRIEALWILHDRYAPTLRGRLSRRCGDPDVVSTAIQDTFVAIWQSARRYRPQGADAAGWIWTIAMRRLVSALRGKESRWIDGGSRSADVLAAAGSAEEPALLGIEHGDLGDALARIPPELREAIVATVIDGLTVKEAARLIGIPEGTVKTRVMRAKARLREELA